MEDVEQSTTNIRSLPLELTSIPSRFRLSDAHPGGSSPQDQNYSYEESGEGDNDRIYKMYIQPEMLGGPPSKCHILPMSTRSHANGTKAFFGRESIWAFLQSIRLAVGGQNDFTDDEQRFSMDEPPSPPLPLNTTLPYPLPEKLETRRGLVGMFLTKV